MRYKYDPTRHILILKSVRMETKQSIKRQYWKMKQILYSFVP